MGSGVPGDIKSMQILPKREMYIQGGCFLASTTNVQTDAKWQGLKGFVSGNGLFFLRATVDSGSPGKVRGSFRIGRLRGIWRENRFGLILPDEG